MTMDYCYDQPNFDISKTSTTVPKGFVSDKHLVKTEIAHNIAQLVDYQKKLYAQHRYGILILFQAMDAAGKDSMINHILSGVNPAGFKVANFKQPSKEDLSHDFLWRINKSLPQRGEIGIFNRSYYEDVLISRVHPEILLPANLPNIQSTDAVTKQLFKQRYHDIRHYESYLSHNGFVILKFFLHMSKSEQKNRFEARIQIPEKNWKFSEADIQERQYWDAYQKAYEQAINHTATAKNPWYVIPSDDKWASRLIVSNIINHRLAKLPLAYPEVTKDQRTDLLKILNRLNESG